MATSEQSEGRGGEGVDSRWGGRGGEGTGGGESTGERRRREKEEEKGRDVATRA